MSKLQSALILVGSPKGKKSASNNIASYIEEGFNKNEVETEKIFVARYKKPDKLKELLKKAFESALIVIVAPLYFDSIPALTIRFMEEFSIYKKSLPKTQQKLMAVFNCGFPEPYQNDVAIKICENFASQTDMEWIGGIAVGMGPSVETKSLKDAGMPAKNLRKGLDAIIDSLSNNETVPPEAIATASKLSLPLFLVKFIYAHFVNSGWKKRVKDKEIIKKMYDRPYDV